MKEKTSKKITAYITDKGQATGKELADFLAITDRAIRKQLNILLKKKVITKIGKPPKVFYLLSKIEELFQDNFRIDTKIEKIIKKQFLMITPSGEKKEGWEGFKFWCVKTGQPIMKTAQEYLKTIEKYSRYKKNGLIDGMNKMKATFKKVYLDHVFYLDFYSIKRFGKTKLGQFLLYAKQSQNKMLIGNLAEEIRHKIRQIIKKFNIDGVAFIPPTVKREVQFMREFEKDLELKIRRLDIVKAKTPFAVPQKTLAKLQDRIENAKMTIFVDDNTVFNNILLIDDAVGSGSTLNETAKKIRERKLCTGMIVALAVTGSFKGFDVISEV